MKRFLLLALAVISLNSFAQESAAPYPGDVLVQLFPGENIDDLIKEMNAEHSILALRADKVLSQELRMYHLKFNPVVPVDQTIRWVVSDERVVAAQGNRPITHRAIPNDLNYGSQWQYNNVNNPNADLDAEDAWDITTGGLTVNGDTIVVAVIDDGIDTAHSDFGDNLWINRADIPGDGIDNDSNGYVDDHLGWNTYTNNDDIKDGNWGGWHGTPVAGIVGAQGNDSNGVSGVNWDVKVMVIVGGGGESDALAAYGYVLTQRRRYNQSEGTEGAYIVSTNASWGVDFGQPSSAPLWCNFYDSLGLEGVLNCGATINGNYDVDVIGDLPTACPSDYLISVTNMNNQDVKVTGAGYGDSTIDMGAYGQGTYTTDLGDTYGGFGGTSGATPHVTGTLALMYSAACNQLADLARSYPDSAALIMRKILFRSTVLNFSLNNITTTDGKLNMLTALEEVEAYCDSLRTIGLGELDAPGRWQVYPNPAATEINIVPLGTPATLAYTLYNTLGQPVASGRNYGQSALIDVSGLAAGWYVLELQNPDEAYVERRKIVIE
ncbi:S8 family peptidase [Cryomorphaceae bacterium]|nr:S8 family peptidase [Cryomorphaceae bacterium]